MFRFHRRYQGKLKGVIFDWAGTTVDHGSCAPAGVFVDVFKKFGLNISLLDARGPMGLPKRDHIEKVLSLPHVQEQFRSANGRAYNSADIDAMYAAFTPMQIECLEDYADPIPGVVELIDKLRKRKLKIGGTTGYNQAMMDVLEPAAKKRGYAPDASACVSDVPAGRPAPWMCLSVAEKLNLYPFESLVKVGDTFPDIDEGLNGGMWTVAVARTGNELGLPLAELEKIPAVVVEQKLAKIHERFYQAGAHYVIDSAADLLPVLDDIERRLAGGDHPLS